MFKTLRQKFTSGIGSLRRKFGYEAGQETKTRKTRVVSLMSEDEELNLTKRRKAMSAGRDIRRRFAIVAWAARVHCNYVSRFTFQCQIKGNEDFNSYVESLIREQSKRGNFEVTGRHSLNSFMRIAEACRTIDGDIGIMKLSDGRIQAIESDRIQNPKQIDPYISPRKNEKWTHGVRTNDAGAAIEYSIFKRNGKGGYEFERIVPAEHMILHGYFDRFDQVRGIGILTPGTNTFEDVYENYDLALAKTKLSQIFGIKFTTNEGVGPELTDGLDEKRQGRANSLKGKAA